MVAVDFSQMTATTNSTPCGGESASDSEYHWWLVHVKSRQEKMLAADLGRLGISHYLPLVRERRRYGKRCAWVDLPLFGGYLFLEGEWEECYKAKRTNRAVSVSAISDQATIRAELDNIRRITASHIMPDLHPRLRSGQRCQVIAGPLRGLQGVVLRWHGKWKVSVGITAIGQSVELEVAPSDLMVVD